MTQSIVHQVYKRILNGYAIKYNLRDLNNYSGFLLKREYNMREYKKIDLNEFYNITYRIIKQQDDIKGNLFSDSLLAYSSTPAVLVNAVTKIYRECLKKNNTYDFDLSKYFLLPRGGISFGVVDIQNLN